MRLGRLARRPGAHAVGVDEPGRQKWPSVHSSRMPATQKEPAGHWRYEVRVKGLPGSSGGTNASSVKLSKPSPTFIGVPWPPSQKTEAPPQGSGSMLPAGAKKPAGAGLGSVVFSCAHVKPAGHTSVQRAELWSAVAVELA